MTVTGVVLDPAKDVGFTTKPDDDTEVTTPMAAKFPKLRGRVPFCPPGTLVGAPLGAVRLPVRILVHPPAVLVIRTVAAASGPDVVAPDEPVVVKAREA